MSMSNNCLYETENRIVTFKSASGLGLLTIQPAKDSRTGRYLGVKTLSPDEQMKSPYFVTPQTKKVLETGFTLDLSNCIDRTDYEWMMYSKGICRSYEAHLSDEQCYFYIYDEMAEAKKSLVRADLIREALNFIAATPDSELARKARLLNEPGWSSFTPIRIRQLLQDMAQHPKVSVIQKLLAMYKDREAESKLFLYNLLDKGIVKNIAEVYKYGDLNLGIGEAQAIAFLQDPNNKDLRAELLHVCYPELSKELNKN